MCRLFSSTFGLYQLYISSITSHPICDDQNVSKHFQMYTRDRKSLQLKAITLGTSLAVQRLRLSASTVKGMGSTPAEELRSCMSHENKK